MEETYKGKVSYTQAGTIHREMRDKRVRKTPLESQGSKWNCLLCELLLREESRYSWIQT